MKRRVGIFVDVNNIYYYASRHYKNRKLSYTKYRNFVADFGEITQALAYGSQLSCEAAGFIRALKKANYQTKYKTAEKGYDADWNIGMIIDIVHMSSRLDIVVLGSSDRSLAPVVDWCVQQGISVYVIACGISAPLKESATECIEIPESLLEDKRAATKTEG